MVGKRSLRRQRWVGWTLAIVCWSVVGCDGPAARTAPRTTPAAAQPAASGQQENQRETVENEGRDRAEIVAESEIPVPSGELLSLGTSCTVRVLGKDFQGSGVIVHKVDGEIYVLTVAHAVRLGLPETIELYSLLSYPEPKAKLQEIELISTEERADLALLKVVLGPDVEVKIAPLAKLSEPEFAYSSGCVGENPPKIIGEQILRSDEISVRLNGSLEKRFMWETSRPQESGRSGGPLLNDKGSLLGIALGKSGGYGYYTHMREISKYFVDNGLAGLVTCPQLLSNHQERK